SLCSLRIGSQSFTPLASRENVSLTSMMRARFSARSMYLAIQKLLSAKRASRLLKYPGVLRAAALGGINDERAFTQCNPRESSGQHPAALPRNDVGSQIDV